MNPSQAKLMRWLDSEWSKAQRAAGKPCDRAARLAFYQRLTGRVVTSSKELRDPEITKIKRHVLALAQPDNYPAQIKSLEDEEAVKAGLRARIDAAIATLIADRVFKDDFHRSCVADKYLESTTGRMFGRATSQLTVQELRKLTIELEQGAKRKAAKAARVTPTVEDDGNPF